MPIDINLLRKEKGGDPDKVRESEKRRFVEEDHVSAVIELDELWRKANYNMETAKFQKGKISKEVGERKKKDKNDKCEDLKEKIEEISK